MRRISSRLVGLLSLGYLISVSGSVRGSDRWEAIGLAGTIGTKVVLDPASATTIYAATQSGVFKTTDGAARWDTANSGLSDLNVHGLAISNSGLFALTAHGLFRSTDGAASWRPIRETASNSVTFRSFAVSASTVYASTARCVLVNFDCTWVDGVLYRSNDAGATWGSAGLTGDVVTAIAVDPMSPDVVFAGVQGSVNRGVYRSTDGGQSFAPSSSGLTGTYVFSLDVAVARPSTVFAETNSGVFRSDDRGSTWTSANGELPAGAIALGIDPTNANTVYAGTDNSGVFKTTDGGEHWSALSTANLTDLHVVSVALDRLSPSVVYAGTFGAGIFKLTHSVVGGCSPGATTLCLGGGRFQVEVMWVAVGVGNGAGKAMPLTSDGGGFWFFSPNNLELVVKVVDGRAFNGHFWAFYGALSNVEYRVTVTDTESGRVKTYVNPSGRLASVADTETF